MKPLLTVKEHKKMMEEYKKVTYKCKCGHSVLIPEWLEKTLCDWCGTYVFRDKKKEFEYRLREKMK